MRLLVFLLAVCFTSPVPLLSISEYEECNKDTYLKSYVWAIYYRDTCDSSKVKYYKTFQLREVFEDGIWKKKIYNQFGTIHLGYWYSDGAGFSLNFMEALTADMNYTGCTSDICGYIGDGYTAGCLFYSSTIVMVRGSAIH